QLGSYMDDGIRLSKSCDNNIIMNNDLINVDMSSVYLGTDCNNNTIYHNNLTGSLYGVDLYDSCNQNNISNNFGSLNSYGIRLQYDCSKNWISTNKLIHGGQQGINLWDSCNNNIINNELRDNGYYGITVEYHSNNNEIINNTIENVSHGGIFLTSSSDSIVSNNTMLGCGIHFGSSTVVQLTSNTIHSNNTANGKPIYYYISKNGLNALDFINAGQIILVNCSNCNIEFYSFDNVTVGIQLLYTNQSNVLYNTAIRCTYGYYQEGGYDNLITQNQFSNNIAGIDLEDTDFNNVSYNIVSSNNNYGIWIGLYCNNNTIHDNTGASNGLGGFYIRMSTNNKCYNNIFSGSSRGIELLDADENFFTNNRISSVQFGFLLQLGCEHNQFSGNNITSAYGSGIHLISSDFNEFTNNIIKSCSGTGASVVSGVDNVFSLNAFLLNYIQGQDSGTNTQWTKNSLGNYWDDYTGNDTNSDGIGDTPYFIPPNGIDNRPLMEYPFTGSPPILAELFMLNSYLTNSSLTIIVKNSGHDVATGITILVNIESIPLILYNNSLTPFDLLINEIKVIEINLLPFYMNFTWGETYNITVTIDPQNQIIEEDELNNQVVMEYHYQPSLLLPDLMVNNFLLTSDELWVYVKNTGDYNAIGVEIVVEIKELSLILYNNSLIPVDIDINEVFIVYVDLSDYDDYFTGGEQYNITLTIDPRNVIAELNETNNLLLLQYSHPQQSPSIPWMVDFLLVCLITSIAFLGSKLKKYEINYI
ncbi:MAG: NosD domain-containing protein, partial [Candidatus Thorarchaeota archaeon]